MSNLSLMALSLTHKCVGVVLPLFMLVNTPATCPAVTELRNKQWHYLTCFGTAVGPLNFLHAPLNNEQKIVICLVIVMDFNEFDYKKKNL